MRLLDREYFEVLAGRKFASDRRAIWYYLKHQYDPVLALALNPLIEQDWISTQGADGGASWYHALATRSDLFSTSPAFDPVVYGARAGRQFPRGTRQALRHFLAHADSATPMPMATGARGDTRPWSEFRAAAMDSARRYVEQIHLRRPRTVARWNEFLEHEFVNGLPPIAGDGAEITELVTVIMSVRNRAEAIVDAIASVRRQSYPHWELLVVDDGSTDETRAVVRSLADIDTRVRLIEQEPTGVSSARNRGLRAARGDLVAFLDSDNRWMPRFLEYSLRAMAAGSLPAVHSGVELHRDGGEIRYRGLSGTRADLLYAGNFIDLNSFVARRSLLAEVGGFDESLKRWVDYDLFLSLSREVVPTYLPFLGVSYDDRTSAGRITGSEVPGWEDVVLGKHLIDWRALDIAVERRVPGLVTIVIPTVADWVLTATAVRSVIDNADGVSIEIIVVDNGSRRHVSAILTGLFGGDDRVQTSRMARNLNFALANNVAIAMSRGEFVLMLNNDTQVEAGWLEPLLDGLRDDRVMGTQPLLLYPDGTIQTAGTVFLKDEELPRHYLTGLATDSIPIDSSDSFSAVTAAALCMRAKDLIALHGFDPIYTNGLEDVDLCLRALELRPGGRFSVISRSRVIHHEGSTPGRSRAARTNRELFVERWSSRLPPPDDWRYHTGGLAPVEG
jgi:glycosyltransferase involved in cell wall biosynthesis